MGIYAPEHFVNGPVRPTSASPSAATGGRTLGLGTPRASFTVGLSTAPRHRRAGLPPVIVMGLILSAAVVWIANGISLLRLLG